MNQGIDLVLRMGSFNTSPVPEAVVEALSSLEVTTSVGAAGGFQMTFTHGKDGPFARLQASGFFDPRRRVVIAVTVNGTTEVLMDGIITRQDFTPSSAAGKSSFHVTGVDLTQLMDLFDFTGIPHPALPEAGIVKVILAKYAVLGVKTIAIPTQTPHLENPLSHFPKQVGTDYQYVTKLAADVGASFFLIPGPAPGKSIAYWGPDPTKELPGAQPALSINLDAANNVDSLTFGYDGTVPKGYAVTILPPKLKAPLMVPLPNVGAIKGSKAAHAPKPLKYERLTPVAHKPSAAAALSALGATFRNTDLVTGSGELDVVRYGHVLKIRQLCAIRGATAYYDGLYYLKTVKHTIKRGEYKQQFDFERGGYGSSVKAVPL